MQPHTCSHLPPVTPVRLVLNCIRCLSAPPHSVFLATPNLIAAVVLDVLSHCRLQSGCRSVAQQNTAVDRTRQPHKTRRVVRILREAPLVVAFRPSMKMPIKLVFSRSGNPDGAVSMVHTIYTWNSGRLIELYTRTHSLYFEFNSSTPYVASRPSYEDIFSLSGNP